MADTKTSLANKPAWVELSSTDQKASQEFYSKLFGWKIEVQDDPQYGGYGMAKVDGKDAAGIGGKQPGDPTPSHWNLYIGTTDAKATAKLVEAAGGKVVAEPFAVGDQGTMAVFQDPSGAFISAWQPTNMGAFNAGAPNTFAWGELNARGIDKAVRFYEKVFGWSVEKQDMGGDMIYHVFKHDGEQVAGGMETPPMVPKEIPSYWLVYFTVSDIDKTFEKVKSLGGREMVPPSDFPGGKFAIVGDPQGAAFGLMMAAPQNK